MVNKFIEFEDENSLFERNIDDFYYWHYIRFDIYKKAFWDITQNSKAKDRPTPKDIMTMLRFAFFRNTWFFRKHVDVLAIGFPRKIKNADGIWEDPYTEPVTHSTKFSSLTLEVYSRQFDNSKSDTEHVRFLEETVLHSKIAVKFLNKKQKLKIENETSYIYNLFSVFNTPLTYEYVYQLLRNAYCARRIFKAKLRRILKKITPYCIIETPSYNIPAMVTNELALENGTPTVEIEHGFFTEEAVPQNFYRKRHIPSYPQYFFTVSQYGKDNIRFPIDIDNVKVVGSPYLEKCVANRKSAIIKGEIVLLGDNRNSDKIISFAIKLLDYIAINHFTDYHVTLKAHPTDTCSTPAWKKILSRTDITCITGINGKNVYDCLETAEIVVGIHSSTLFEAQAYGCRVYIIKDDASKVMGKFVEQGYGTYATNPADLFTPFDTADVKVLWHPDALNSTLREIDKLVEKSRGTLQ